MRKLNLGYRKEKNQVRLIFFFSLIDYSLYFSTTWLNDFSGPTFSFQSKLLTFLSNSTSSNHGVFYIP